MLLAQHGGGAAWYEYQAAILHSSGGGISPERLYIDLE